MVKNKTIIEEIQLIVSYFCGDNCLHVMNKYFLVLLAALPVLFSCKRNGGGNSFDDNGAETILYDMDNTPSLPLKDVVELTKVIRLDDSDPNGLVGSIDELLYVNGVFVVADKYTSQRILTFDSNGKFISKISALGNGPREYNSVRDVCITPKGNIGIVDTQKKRILEFTVDGKYVTTIQLPCVPYYTEFLNNDTLVLCVAVNANNDDVRINESEFFTMDRKMNGIGYWGEDKYFKTGRSVYATTRKMLYRYGDSVYCSLLEDNVIYKVTDDTIVPKYNLRMAPDALVAMWDEKNHDEDDLITWMNWYNRQPRFSGSFIELEDYSLVKFYAGYYTPWLLYDHRKKQTFALTELDDDPLFSCYFRFTEAVMDDGHSIVSWNNAGTVLMHERLGPEIDNGLLKEACKGLTEESNPLLFVFTFK